MYQCFAFEPLFLVSIVARLPFAVLVTYERKRKQWSVTTSDMMSLRTGSFEPLLRETISQRLIYVMLSSAYITY